MKDKTAHTVSAPREFCRDCKRRLLARRRAHAPTPDDRIALNSQLNWLELWHGCLRLRSTPRTIQVGTNLFCNLRCNFCRLNRPDTQNRLAGKTREERELSPRVTRQLLQLVPYAERVTLTPLGEPLLWSGLKDFLTQVAAMKSANLEMTSNGMALEQFAPLLTPHTMRHITLSVDSNDPETYAAMRLGGDLRQVERGIRALTDRPRDQRPKITVAATFMRRNIEQLPSMTAWAKNLGIDVLAVQLMDIENPQHEPEHLSRFPDLTQRMIAQAMTNAREQNFCVVLAPGMNRFLTQEHPEDADPPDPLLIRQCTDPWSELLIDTDGDCRPCCWAGISYGNLNSDPFPAVWNSPSAAQTRRLFLQNTLPQGCQNRHCRVRQP